VCLGAGGHWKSPVCGHVRYGAYVIGVCTLRDDTRTDGLAGSGVLGMLEQGGKGIDSVSSPDTADF
jgi:hypothetical protein